MRTRRSFLIACGAGVLALPRGALAQSPSKSARIAFFYYGSRQSSLDTGRYDAFVQGIRELGYAEGRTKNIPVVAAVTADPVGEGYAASMARPGGNITGLSVSATDLGPKLLDLLKALKHRLPSMSVNREHAEAGGLMSYGPNLIDNYRRAGTYVDKILKGIIE